MWHLGAEFCLVNKFHDETKLLTNLALLLKSFVEFSNILVMILFFRCSPSATSKHYMT